MSRFLALSLILLPVAGPARVSSPATMAEGGPLVERVKAYVAAFNSGDSATIRNFYEANFSPAALRQTPVQERLKRSAELRGKLGLLTIRTVRMERGDIVTATIASGNEGSLEFTFEAEAQEPHRLERIRIEKPEESEEPAPAPAVDRAGWIAGTRATLDSLTAGERFSGVVLIASDDSVLLLQAYGFADREQGIPNTTETRFNIGSICKSFTHAAIHRLASEGKLSLNDHVGRFLPDYPNREAAEKVTIAHLLGMQSGIPDFFGDRYERARKEELRTLRDYLPLFADKPLEFAPGSARRYSNGGFLVLGLIIEQVSGIDYDKYIRDHIFAAAGMSASSWHEKSERRDDIARGYTSPAKVRNYETLPQKGSSAGGGYSTARDLLRYAQAVRDGKVASPGSERGFGLAGGAPGLNAALESDAERGFVIVVLSNLDPPAAESVARRIRLSFPGK